MNALEHTLLIPPFLAGLLVLSTHVPLGREVLSRGVVFIDLAVAQFAALGVIAAQALGWEEQPLLLQGAGFFAAAAGAYLLSRLEGAGPLALEALIGVLFVLAASIGLLLLAHNPHGGEHFTALLSGQILWVGYKDLIPVALLYLALFTLWRLISPRRSAVFYLLFALAITASVQLVGIYLVFASLIIPAFATRRLPAPRALPAAYLMGASSYAAGLLLSLRWDLPAGPLIVCALAGFAPLAWGVARISHHPSTADADPPF